MEDTAMDNPMSKQMSAETARIRPPARTCRARDRVARPCLGHCRDRPGRGQCWIGCLRQREHQYVSPYDVALVYTGLGDKDRHLTGCNELTRNGLAS